MEHRNSPATTLDSKLDNSEVTFAHPDALSFSSKSHDTSISTREDEQIDSHNKYVQTTVNKVKEFIVQFFCKFCRQKDLLIYWI